MSGEQLAARSAERIQGRLFEIATPELYRQNAFRVLGLPVTATTGDIRRWQTRLQTMKKLGMTAPSTSGGYMPLKPPPDADAILKAVQRLHDPETRLLDELFWFWRHDLGTDSDEALAHLAQKEMDEAQHHWLEYEKSSSKGKTSTHNLAVFYHTFALDLECRTTRRALSQKEQETCRECWTRAYKRWELLLNDSGFWERVGARVRELDDPRLTKETARAIWTYLPETILTVNARIAVRNAESGNQAEAKRHVQVMLASVFDHDLVYTVLRKCLASTRQRIRMACERAEHEAKANPANAGEIAQGVLRDAVPLLGTADMVLRVHDPFREGMHDEIARMVRECTRTCCNEKRDLEEGVPLLDRAHELAGTESLRTEIREELDAWRGILEQEREYERLKRAIRGDQVCDVEVRGDGARLARVCTCCMVPAEIEQTVTRSWEETSGSTRYKHTRSFRFPLCEECRRHQASLSNRRIAIVLLAVAISVVISYLIGTNISRVQWGIFLVIASGLTVVILALLSCLIRVEELGDNHASRGPSVEIVAASEGGTVFRFWNPLFAHLFAGANEVAVTSCKALKYSRGTNLLRGRSAAQVIAVTTILAVAGHWIVYGLAKERWDRGVGRPWSQSESGPTPSSRLGSYSAPRSAPPPEPRSSEYGWANLESRINAAKAQLRAAESELTPLKSQLESLSSRIQTYKGTIDGYESQARQGVGINSADYRQAIDDHNALVDRYNRLLEEFNSKLAKYKADLDTLNEMLRRYNSGAR